MDIEDVVAWIKAEGFKFDSKEQELGLRNFHQWLRGKFPGIRVNSTEATLVVYFAQKDHESNEWWRELLASREAIIREELWTAMDEIAQLRAEVGVLKAEKNKL